MGYSHVVFSVAAVQRILNCEAKQQN